MLPAAVLKSLLAIYHYYYDLITGHEFVYEYEEAQVAGTSLPRVTDSFV